MQAVPLRRKNGDVSLKSQLLYEAEGSQIQGRLSYKVSSRSAKVAGDQTQKVTKGWVVLSTTQCYSS